jgi:hypothetical protein
MATYIISPIQKSKSPVLTRSKQEDLIMIIMNTTTTTLLAEQMIHHRIFKLGRDVMIFPTVELALDCHKIASIIDGRSIVIADLFHHECCTFAELVHVKPSVIEQRTRLLEGK